MLYYDAAEICALNILALAFGGLARHKCLEGIEVV
jgi:hypothetical protein